MDNNKLFEKLNFNEYGSEEMIDRARSFYRLMDGRRSVRHFSERDVPAELIRYAILTANTAPSGAHKQPWTFVAVSDPELKKEIRIAAENEEKTSYTSRMSDEWKEAIEPLGTTWQKPFIETVPWLVICFAQRYVKDVHGSRIKHYYVQESCGIACGLFIAAVHQMGLATLTHTPSPMRFLGDILARPKSEQAYMLFPVGYPNDDAEVPVLRRKGLDEMSVWR